MLKHQLLVTGTAVAFGFVIGSLVGLVGAQPNAGAIRLTLAKDGSVMSVQGQRGGNWEESLAMVTTKPTSLGEHVASIDVYEHNGSEEDLVVGGGSAHPHSGPATPPWNTHCHLWVVAYDGSAYLAHC